MHILYILITSQIFDISFFDMTSSVKLTSYLFPLLTTGAFGTLQIAAGFMPEEESRQALLYL